MDLKKPITELINSMSILHENIQMNQQTLSSLGKIKSMNPEYDKDEKLANKLITHLDKMQQLSNDVYYELLRRAENTLEFSFNLTEMDKIKNTVDGEMMNLAKKYQESLTKGVDTSKVVPLGETGKA